MMPSSLRRDPSAGWIDSPTAELLPVLYVLPIEFTYLELEKRKCSLIP